MNRLGMKYISEMAGVSLSTVDRTLNDRGVVRPATRDKIMKIAQDVGYLSPDLPTPKAIAKKYHVVIPESTNAFLDQLSQAIHASSIRRGFGSDVTIFRIPSFDAQSLCEQLDRIDKSDGVAIIALDHPRVRDSIRNLASRNIPIVTLVSDVENCERFAYVGSNNRAAGRLAGHLLLNFLKKTSGTIALFRGSPNYRGHEDRENGFRAKLVESGSPFKLVLASETNDDIEGSRNEVNALIRQHPDLCGIYNVAAGNRGIAMALADTGRENSVVFIAHELTSYSREYLINGTIDALLDQNPILEAEIMLDLLENHANGRHSKSVFTVPTQVYFSENLV